MSGNDKKTSRYFGDSSQLTDWVLDSGSTCYMTPQVSDFIPGSLEGTVAYGHNVTANKKDKFK